MTRSPSAWAAGAKCTAGEGPRRVCISQDREPGIWKVVYSLRCSVHELEKGVRLTRRFRQDRVQRRLEMDIRGATPSF